MKIHTPVERWLASLVGLKKKWAERNFPARDVWGVGLVKAPLKRFLNGWPDDAVTVWLDNPAQGDYADPFAQRIDGRIVVFSEHVPRPGMRGEIVARELGDDDRLRNTTSVLRLPIHVSYPFLIQQNGTRYCIPETFQANAVLLFRAIGDQPRWVFDRKLIDGFAAVDSSVIYHEQRYWLFCTRFAHEKDNPAISELHIWHASDIRGPWSPHERNPVKIDRSNSRPAGTPFVHDGELFRPAQDCSRTYGEAVIINRVATITESEFAEDVIAVIEPRKDSPFPDGLHHLSAFGDVTFVDGKRTVRDAFGYDQIIPPPEGSAFVASALEKLAR